MTAFAHSAVRLKPGLLQDRFLLNRDYLGKDRPTNVISFALNEGECSGLNPEVLGDVVISAPTAAREAAEAHADHPLNRARTPQPGEPD